MYDGQGVKCLIYKIIKFLRKKKETPKKITAMPDKPEYAV